MNLKKKYNGGVCKKLEFNILKVDSYMASFSFKKTFEHLLKFRDKYVLFGKMAIYFIYKIKEYPQSTITDDPLDL